MLKGVSWPGESMARQIWNQVEKLGHNTRTGANSLVSPISDDLSSAPMLSNCL